MSIKDWPEGERPREKLLAQGAENLSDAELLAIFLRVGVAGKSAVDLAREQLAYFGSLRTLLAADQTALCAAPGMGPAKFVQLRASLEMARRYLQQSLQQGDVLTSPEMTKNYLQTRMRDLPHEEFHVLFLNSQHALIRAEVLFRGTIDAAAVYPREVVKQSLLCNASAVIFAHNHPSGVAEPSSADLRITKTLVNALNTVGIRALDHMVVGEADVVSFAERGLI